MSVDEINNSLKVTGATILLLTVSMIYVQFRDTPVPDLREADQFTRFVCAYELVFAKASGLRQSVSVKKPPISHEKEGERFEVSKILSDHSGDIDKPVLQFLKEKFAATDRVAFHIIGDDNALQLYIRLSEPEKIEELRKLYKKEEGNIQDYFSDDDGYLLKSAFEEESTDELKSNSPEVLKNYDFIKGSVEAIVDTRDLNISLLNDTTGFWQRSVPPDIIKMRVLSWAQEHGIDETSVPSILAKYNRMITEGKPPVNLPLFNIEINHKTALSILPLLVWCFFLKYYFLLQKLAVSKDLEQRTKPFVFLDVWSAAPSKRKYFRVERFILRVLFTSLPVFIVFSAHSCVGLLWYYIRNRSNDITYMIEQSALGFSSYDELYFGYALGLSGLHVVTIPMVLLSVLYLFRIAQKTNSAGAAAFH